MNLNIANIFTYKNLSKIILGTLILSIGTSFFVIPFELVYGGVSGIAVSLSHFFSLGQGGTDILIYVLTWSLFILGYFTLGKSFALKTVVSSFLYPIFVSLFSRLVSPDVFGGFFYLKGSLHSEISVLLAAVFGGALTGAGCALTFSGGGSTGGTDIISFILCKNFESLKSSVSIFLVDAFVILLGVLSLGDFTLSLIGIIAAFVSAISIEKLFLPESMAFVAQIISSNSDKINSDIIKILNRTTTVIDVTGGFTGKKMKMIFFSFTLREYATVTQIVSDADKNAFVAVHRAHEINGEGWRKKKKSV